MTHPRGLVGVRGAPGQNVDEERAEHFSEVSGRTDDIPRPLGKPVERSGVRAVPVGRPGEARITSAGASLRSSTFFARQRRRAADNYSINVTPSRPGGSANGMARRKGAQPWNGRAGPPQSRWRWRSPSPNFAPAGQNALPRLCTRTGRAVHRTVPASCASHVATLRASSHRSRSIVPPPRLLSSRRIRGPCGRACRKHSRYVPVSVSPTTQVPSRFGAG